MNTPTSTNELARATIKNHFAIVSRRLLVFAAGFGVRTTAGPAALRLAVTGHSMVRGGNVAGGGLCAGPAKVQGPPPAPPGRGYVARPKATQTTPIRRRLVDRYIVLIRSPDRAA